jgi:hypothetical protein
VLAIAAPQGRARGAKVTRVDGIRFASKLEADRYCELKLLQRAGEVVYFLRQVPFVVAPGVTYRCDFFVLWNRSRAPREVTSVEDCKGHLTGESRIKIASVQERYGITVRLLTRKDVQRWKHPILNSMTPSLPTSATRQEPSGGALK